MLTCWECSRVHASCAYLQRLYYHTEISRLRPFSKVNSLLNLTYTMSMKLAVEKWAVSVARARICCAFTTTLKIVNGKNSRKSICYQIYYTQWMQSWLLRIWPRPRLTCAFAATATAIAALKILKSSFATKSTMNNHCKADFREFSRLHGSCAHSQLLPHWKFSKVNSLLNYYIQCLQNWFLRIYPPPRLVCSFAAIVTLKSLKIQFATNFIIYNDYKTGFWEFSRLYCSCAHSQLLYYHTTCALQSTQARPGKHRCACVCMCICICTYVYICVHACVWIC